MQKVISFASAALLGLFASAGLSVQGEPPAQQPPERQHQWLQQFVGEWAVDSESTLPGQAEVRSKGTESVRSLGNLWIVSDTEGMHEGMPVRTMVTLGYDPEKDRFVGTSVCTTSSHLWNLQGKLDDDNKTLTLETEGPDPTAPGATTRIQHEMKLKSLDEKVLTTSVRGKDGQWVKIHTMTFHRGG